jgi:hypothetical protein
VRLVIWVALGASIVALALALVAMWQARRAIASAEESRRRAVAAEQRVTSHGARITRRDAGAVEATLPQLIAAALDDGDGLSNACHVVTRALDNGAEPPTAGDYAGVHRCVEAFTASIARMRAPDHGDTMRELTDELVTLQQSLVAEVRQHQEIRYPFIGAKDTTLVNLVLSRFDAELARLRLYQQTGHVTTPERVPVDFETVRFVPRETSIRPEATPEAE